MTIHPAVDGEEVASRIANQDWLMSWHPRVAVPEGTRHGSAGICVPAQGQVVLISPDAVHWDLPAGRPESDETWEETLRREILEEACATVRSARLLGFVRGRCVRGQEAGLVLVRAFWLVDVVLGPWMPEHEVAHRKVVPISHVADHLVTEPAFLPLYRRAFEEAGLRDSEWTVAG